MGKLCAQIMYRCRYICLEKPKDMAFGCGKEILTTHSSDCPY